METFNSYPDTRQQEYSSLRRHGLLVGACLLGYFLLQNVLVVALRFSGLYDAYLNNAAFQYAVSTVFVTALCLGLPFFLLSKRKGSLSYWKVLPFNAPADKSKALYLVCAAFAVCLAANYCATYFDAFLSGIGIETTDIEMTESVTLLDTVLNFVCAAFAAPLVEEFVFRGVIMQPLRRFGDHFAVIASAVLFGLSHGSPSNVFFAFIAGVAMGYAVILSKSLWVGIAIHFLNNFYAVALYEIYNWFPNMNDAVYLILLVVIFALGAGGAAALLIRRDIAFSESNCSLSKGRRARAFFANIPMVLALGYLVVSMLLFIQ